MESYYGVKGTDQIIIWFVTIQIRLLYHHMNHHTYHDSLGWIPVYAEISFFNDWFLKTVEILKQYEITIRQVQSMLECFASHIRKKNYQISSRTWCKIKIVHTAPFNTHMYMHRVGGQVDKTATEMSYDWWNIFTKHNAQCCYSSLKLKFVLFCILLISMVVFTSRK